MIFEGLRDVQRDFIDLAFRVELEVLLQLDAEPKSLQLDLCRR
jgi:hypothetical protein